MISPPGLRRVNLEQQMPWSVVVELVAGVVVEVDGVVEVEVAVVEVEEVVAST